MGVAWSGLKEFSLSRGKCVEYGSGKQEGVGHHQIVVLILHNHPHHLACLLGRAREISQKLPLCEETWAPFTFYIADGRNLIN